MLLRKAFLILTVTFIYFGVLSSEPTKDPKSYQEIRVFLNEIEDKLISYESILRNDSSDNALHLKSEIYSLLNHNQKAVETIGNIEDVDRLTIEEKRILFLWYFYNNNFHQCINLIYELNESEKYRNFSSYYLKALSKKINYKETSKFLYTDYDKPLTSAQNLDKYLYSKKTGSKETFTFQNNDSINEKFTSYIIDTANYQYADYHSYIIENNETWNITNSKNVVHAVNRLIKIISNEGKDINSTLVINYNALSQKVKINQINIYKPDGSIFKVPVDSYTSIHSPWYGDYSSEKEMRITIPQLELNAVLFLDYEIETNNYDELSFPGFNILLNTEIPINKQSYQVKLAKNNKAKIRYSSGIKFTENISLGDTLFRWELNNTFPAKIEDYVDNFHRYKFIEISLIPSWDKLHESLVVGYLENNLTLDPKMKTLVDSLTKRSDSPKEKVKELYYWVNENINFIALEYGKGSIIPRSAQNTFYDGFGDCKDQTILFIAFLKHLGINAYPALLNISSREIVDTTFSSFNFNHCIAYVELQDTSFFLDPVKNNNSFDYLFPSNQNRLAFTIKPKHYNFKKTPLISSKQNLEKREITIDINKDNKIFVSKRLKNKGIMGIIYKNFFEQIEKSDVQEVVEYDLYQFCPGAELTGYNVSFNQKDKPFDMSETFEVNNWLQNINNTLYIFKVPTLFFSFDETSSKERIYPIYYQTTALKEYEINISYPESYDVLFMATNESVSNKYVDFSYHVKKTGSKIFINIKYNRKTDLVPTNDYVEVKEIHDMILNKIEEQFVFNIKRKID